MEENHLEIISCVQAVIQKLFFSKPVAIRGLVTYSSDGADEGENMLK